MCCSSSTIEEKKRRNMYWLVKTIQWVWSLNINQWHLLVTIQKCTRDKFRIVPEPKKKQGEPQTTNHKRTLPSTFRPIARVGLKQNWNIGRHFFFSRLQGHWHSPWQMLFFFFFFGLLVLVKLDVYLYKTISWTDGSTSFKLWLFHTERKEKFFSL